MCLFAFTPTRKAADAAKNPRNETYAGGERRNSPPKESVQDLPNFCAAPTREVTLVRKGLYGVRNLARTRALGGYMNELSRPLLFAERV